MAKRTDLKMPYGIADFKRIRNEGWYYVDKTEYLAKTELVRCEEIQREAASTRPARPS